MLTSTNRVAPEVRRFVLNAGSGPGGPRSLHGCFTGAGWSPVRLDVNPDCRPDYVGSVTDMRVHFGDAMFDAVWSSHALEHLYAHEVPRALAEFRRVLRPQGFALVTCPDLEAVAELIIERGLDFEAYRAPAGPITVHDMIFGHTRSIMAGDAFMSHKTGFTRDSLGRAALEAGFAAAHIGRGDRLDLWGVLLMRDTDTSWLERVLRPTEAGFLFAEAPQCRPSPQRLRAV